MKGIDLNVYDFDYDLTFAVLLMNADGTIYHTYGGRDHVDASSHLSLASLERTLARGLESHVAYAKAPDPPKKWAPMTVERLPKWRGKNPDCFHCHQVNEAIIEDLQERGSWSLDRAWFWPDPIEVGLRLDRDEQTRVVEVVPRSAAAKAGLQAGDRITRLGGSAPQTFGDVQRVLDDTPNRTTTLPVEWLRGSVSSRAQLELAKGWKEATPLTYSWRAAKWPMSPKPGFGGRALTAEQLKNHGLDGFAFRVGYLVTWGKEAHTGRNAARAGLRKGDIVVSVAGKSDFASENHFQTWFRFTRKPGETVKIVVLRDGKRQEIRLKVVE